MTNKKYYNAKPSKVNNIGKDVSGAKRHNFETYENDAEKATRKAHNKKLKELKETLKAEVIDGKKPLVIAETLESIFEATYKFSIYDPFVDEKIKSARESAKEIGTSEAIKEFNKLVGAYNKVRKEVSGLNYGGGAWAISKLQKRYKTKKTFTESNGKTFDWKNFEHVESITADSSYLNTNSNAVQFGNSVSDNERAYIVQQLAKFLKAWKSDSIFSKSKLSDISWSFGARGKAGSVAYYLDAQTLISVNRNNIGSLVHELGHYLDYKNGLLSNKISFEYINKYRQELKDQGMKDYKSLNYYTSKKEIFARAFEAYCYKVQANFGIFAQFGDAYLPELDDDMLNLIGECFS